MCSVTENKGQALKVSCRLFLLSVVSLSITLCEAASFADDTNNVASPFQFKAKLKVRSSQFKPDGSRIFTIENTVMLSFSNGWWAVDATQLQQDGKRVVQCAMVIPGGVRRYNRFPDDFRNDVDADGNMVTTVAAACPLPFPPPICDALFVSWLSLCPRPKLPIIDATHIHRPLFVTERDSDIINDDQNIGTYSMTYIAGGDFLSDLRITNNGNYVKLEQSNGGFIASYVKFAPPLDQGFLEFKYSLLVTTNYHGVVFPAEAVVERIVSAFDPKYPNKTYTNVITEVQVLTIGELGDQMTGDEVSPAKMIADDFRPANLPEKVAVSYWLTNDGWKPASDPQIAGLVKLKLRGVESEARRSSRAIRIIFALSVLAPLVFGISQFYRRQRLQDSDVDKS